MREQFQKSLEAYGTMAKQELETEAPQAELERLSIVLDWHTEEYARRSNTSVEVQEKIANVQRTKQVIMSKLQADIAALETPGMESEGDASRRRITMINDRFVIEDNSREQTVTVGEIMTDGEWGLNYQFDAASVPRNIRKRYFIETAKRELRDLADQQILLQEIDSANTAGGRRYAYEQIEQRRQAGTTTPGHIAEKMVRNFLKKLTYDFDASFSLLEADVYQDVSQKVDFIIRRKHHRRGVKVEDVAGGDSIGVQFTKVQGKFLEKKVRQIEHSREALSDEDDIDDIVLVSIPRLHSLDMYEQWKVNEPPGGPDSLWNQQIKEKVFRKVMQGILDEDEINQQCTEFTDDD